MKIPEFVGIKYCDWMFSMSDDAVSILYYIIYQIDTL